MKGQVANEHRKRCSSSWVFMETTETPLHAHHNSYNDSRQLSWWEWGTLGAFQLTGGNAKRCSHLGQLLAAPHHAARRVTRCPVILSRRRPEKWEHMSNKNWQQMLRAALFLIALKCLSRGTQDGWIPKSGETLRWNITQRWGEVKYYWCMSCWVRKAVTKAAWGVTPFLWTVRSRHPRTERSLLCACAGAGRGGEQGPRALGCRQCPKIALWRWCSSEESKTIGLCV